MKTILILFLVYLSLGQASRLVPDNFYPIVMSSNLSELKGQTINLRFSMKPTEGVPFDGLPYGGYFGINLHTTLELKAADYTCALKTLDGTLITLSAADSNGTSLFCQLTDPTKPPKLAENTTYTLSVTFSSTVTKSISTVDNLQLFTCLSPTGLKITENISFGSITTYPSYKLSQAASPLNLIDSLVDTDFSNTTIDGEVYFDTFFSTEHTFLVTKPIYKDFYYIVEFDTTYFDAFTSISSHKAYEDSTEAIHAEIPGSLTLETLSPGKILIKGINEALMPGRMFKLRLIGWKSKQLITSGKDVHFYVYYKNSNTVYSYQTAQSLLRVLNYRVYDAEIDGVDGYDFIASEMTWPLKFQFRPSKDLTNVHVVVLSTETTTMDLVYSPATCDFTMNTPTCATPPCYHKLGATPVCHPIKYKNSDGLEVNGFSFFVSSLSASTLFKFNIWAYFRKCSLNKQPDIAVDKGNTFSAQIFLYKNLENSYKFTAPSAEYVYAQSSVFTSVFTKCLTSIQPKLYDNSDATDKKYFYWFELDAYKDEKTTARNYLFAMEFNSIALHTPSVVDDDLMIFNVASALDFSGGHTYSTIDTVAANATQTVSFGTIDEAYLLNTTGSEHLAITAFNPSQMAAMNNDITSSATALKPIYGAFLSQYIEPDTLGKDVFLEIMMKKKWFTGGTYYQDTTGSYSGVTSLNQLCFVIWDLIQQPTADDTSNIDIALNYVIDIAKLGGTNTNAGLLSYVISSDFEKTPHAEQSINFLHQGIRGTIDKSNLPGIDDTLDYYCIRSVSRDSTAANDPAIRFNFPTGKENLFDDPAAKKYRIFALYTNCIKVDKTKAASSLFDNFEVLAVLRYQDGTGKKLYSRMLRMNSFVIMLGPLGSTTQDVTDTGATRTILSVTDFSNSKKGICMTTIDSAFYKPTAAPATELNFLLFLNHVHLFETDYSTHDNSYPISDLSTKFKAYAFNSRFFFRQEGEYKASLNKYTALNLNNVNTLDNPNKNANYEASHNFTMASLLWFKNTTDNSTLISTKNGTTASNMVFPHYCMEDFTFIDNESSKKIEFTPFISSVWLKGSHLNDLTFEKRMVQDMTRKSLSANYRTAVDATLNRANDFVNIEYSLKTLYNTADIEVDFTKTSTANSNIKDTKVVSMEAVIVLLNSTMATANPSATITDGYTFPDPDKATAPFYFLGKQYAQALLSVRGTEGTDDLANLGKLTVTGQSFKVTSITRPALSSLTDSTGALDISDQAAIGFIGFGDVDKTFLSFSNVYSVPTGFYSILHLEASGSFTWTVNFTEIGTNQFASGATFKTELVNSASFPSGGEMIFESTEDAFLNASCSLYNSTGYTTPCAITKANLNCPVASSASSFSFCCTNVKLDTNSKFLSKNVTFLYPSPAALSTLKLSNVLENSALTGEKAFTSTTISAPSLEEFSFFDNNIDNSVSAFRMKVNLNQPLRPRLTVTLTGDFTDFYLTGMPTYCRLSFAKEIQMHQWQKGEEILDSCTLTDLEKTEGKIEIKTKTDILDCNSAYESYFYLSLWPAKVTTLSKKIKITVKLNEEELSTAEVTTAYTPNTQKDAVIWMPNVTNPPCDLKVILPTLIGLKADYSFEFNYTELIKQIHDAARYPNEIKLFLREEYFQAEDDLVCSSTDIPDIICFFEGRSTLVLNFKGTHFKPAANIFTVTVHNTNVFPIDATSLKHYCQFASFDIFGEKSIIAYSSGKYEGVIAAPKNATKRLLFRDCSEDGFAAVVRPVLPSEVKFCFVFDRASAHADSFEFSVGLSPFLYVEMPLHYPLVKVPSSLSGTIYVVNREGTLSDYKLLSPTKVTDTEATNIGHTIKLRIQSNVEGDENKFNFSNKSEYFIVTLKNAAVPEEPIADTGIFNIYIANDDFTFTARTYSNTNNMSQGNEISNTGYTFLKYDRGFAYNFDGKNWIADFLGSAEGVSTGKNNITLLAGFYNSVKFTARGSSALQSESTQSKVSISSPEIVIKLRGDFVDFENSTFTFYSINGTQEIFMGVPCLTSPGRYLVNVTADTDSTVKIVPVKKLVVNVIRQPQPLSCDFPSFQIPKNARATFECQIPDVFDDFSLIYQNTTTDDTYSNAKISTTFKKNIIVNDFSTNFTGQSSKINLLRFSVSTTNICLETEKGKSSSDIQIQLSDSQVGGLSSGIDIGMVAYNSKEKTEINPNQLVFEFKTPQYSELACAVVCSSAEFPPEENIYTETVETTNTQGSFKVFSREKDQQGTATISGLKRSETYKMKCLLVSSVVTAKYEFKEFTFSSFKKRDKEGSALVETPIKLTELANTECVKFQFSRPVDPKLQYAILTYCQNQFKTEQTSCTVCMDALTKRQVSGSVFVEQGCTSTTNTIKNKNVSVFNVCAVQSATCGLNTLKKEVLDGMNKLMKDLATAKLMEKNLFGIEIERRNLQIVNIPLKSVGLVEEKPLPKLQICSELNEDSCVKVDNPTLDFFGEYSVSLTFKLDLMCYYQIKNTAEAPQTGAEVVSKPLGNFNTDSMTTVKVSGPGSRYKRGNTFGMYISCPKFDVTYPQYSNDNLVKVFEVSFETLVKTCPKPELDIDPEIPECQCRDKFKNIISQAEEGLACLSSVYFVSILLLLFSLIV